MAAKQRCADLPAPESQKKIMPRLSKPHAGLPLPYIADSLIFEILIRLPAKSAARFRCVSKAWLAMISSRQFVHAHLELSKLRPPTMLIVLKTASWSSWMGFYKYNGAAIRAELVYSEQLPSGVARWAQPLHCDGLILTTTLDQQIMVCNPVTRELVFLPKGSHNNGKHQRVGFGFDPRSNKYKVVRFSFFYLGEHGASESICRSEVLMLGTNAWRRAVDPPYPIVGMAPAHVRGFIYWMVDLPTENDPGVLVRFSLADESFSLIPYPPCNAWPFDFIELDRELCCACFSEPWEGVVEIWACGNTETPTWTRLCTFLLPQVHGALFRNPKLTFFGKDLLIIGDHKMYQYNIGTGQMREVAVPVENLWYCHPDSNNHQMYKKVTFDTVNHVESLVKIRGYT